MNCLDALKQRDQSKAYASTLELRKRSEHSNELYKYKEAFLEMLQDRNSFVRTRGFQLLVTNARWDAENFIDAHIDDLLALLEDEKPITVRQCLKECKTLAIAKPALLPVLIHHIEHSTKVYQEHMQQLIDQDRQRALQELYLLRNVNSEAIEEMNQAAHD